MIRLTDPGDELDVEALKARDLMVKFTKFIIHIHEKMAFRSWKQKTFGLGGDPRLGLIL